MGGSQSTTAFFNLLIKISYSLQSPHMMRYWHIPCQDTVQSRDIRPVDPCQPLKHPKCLLHLLLANQLLCTYLRKCCYYSRKCESREGLGLSYSCCACGLTWLSPRKPGHPQGCKWSDVHLMYMWPRPHAQRSLASINNCWHANQLAFPLQLMLSVLPISSFYRSDQIPEALLLR